MIFPMKKLKYLFQRLCRLNYRQMFQTVNKLHKKTGKSRLWLFRDMVKCGTRYGAGYMDYQLCEFYLLTDAQRATYVTRGINNRLVQLLNKPEAYYKIDNKAEFNILYKDFLRRDWLDFREPNFDRFCAFMEKHEEVVSKPLADACGRGIELLKKSDFADLKAMFDHLVAIGAGLLEEVIHQHPDLSAIYPCSVNTYRIVTVRTEGEGHLIYAFIRIGNGGRFVDNLNAGGMTAPIDLETGKIQYVAYDKDHIYYDAHPMTGTAFVGYQLPFWKESVQMCLDATAVVPELGYVGWDIAVSPEGPQLIEGNYFPGHDILQLPPHVPDRIGMLPQFQKYVKGI